MIAGDDDRQAQLRQALRTSLSRCSPPGPPQEASDALRGSLANTMAPAASAAVLASTGSRRCSSSWAGLPIMPTAAIGGGLAHRAVRRRGAEAPRGSPVRRARQLPRRSDPFSSMVMPGRAETDRPTALGTGPRDRRTAARANTAQAAKAVRPLARLRPPGRHADLVGQTLPRLFLVWGCQDLLGSPLTPCARRRRFEASQRQPRGAYMITATPAR